MWDFVMLPLLPSDVLPPLSSDFLFWSSFLIFEYDPSNAAEKRREDHAITDWLTDDRQIFRLLAFRFMTRPSLRTRFKMRQRSPLIFLRRSFGYAAMRTGQDTGPWHWNRLDHYRYSSSLITFASVHIVCWQSALQLILVDTILISYALYHPPVN